MHSTFNAVNLHFIYFIEDIYSDISKRNSYNYVNDDSTKYFSLSRSNSTFNIIVLHPNNGSHITTKIVTPRASSIAVTNANGRFSNNLMLMHIPVSFPSSDILILVNTDDWTVTTYKSSSYRFLYNFSPIFDTDQILLLGLDFSKGFYTLQAAYDKLDKTEFYSL